MSQKPIFDQASIARINAARADTGEFETTRDAAHSVLKLRTDRTDLHPQLVAGTLIVVREQVTAEPDDMVVVVVAYEHVLRRAPSTDGPVVGVVVGRVEAVG